MRLRDPLLEFLKKTLPSTRPPVSARAQTSVELLIILAVSLTILAVLINFTSDHLSGLQKENAIRVAQQSMQALVEGINHTYAQGPGTVSRVEVTWPLGIVSEQAVLSGNSIVVRVYETDVAGTAVPAITGSLSTLPGTYLVQITAHDLNVQLGSSRLTANVSSIYLPMAQDSNQSAAITLTNESDENATLSYSLNWSPSLVTVSVPSGSYSIPAGGTRTLDLNFFASAGAVGNYVGALSISAAYASAVESLSIPVNVEVFSSSASLLSAVPSSLSFANYSTDSNTLSFQLCNTGSTAITTISFTPSSGNAGDWIQGINTIASLTANTCRSINATVTPASGVPGVYSGSILIKDYTGANSVVLPITVTVSGQSSVFSWDWTTAALGANTIGGFTLRNGGDSNVLLSSVMISRWWLCDSNHSTLTGMTLKGASVFSGSANDGNSADITDTTFSAGESDANTLLQFSGTINNENEQFAASVTFSDGSIYSSSTYGSGCNADATPPARVTDLTADSGPTPGTIRLTWTYPGDDNFTGTPVSAVLRYGYTDVNSASGFAAGTDYPLTTMGAGGTTGSLLLSGLNVGYTYKFALLFKDEVDLNGGISNQASARPMNRYQYSLSQFPGLHFIHSNTGLGEAYAGDANLFRITDLVTSAGTDRNIVIRITDDSNSDHSWIAYLNFSATRLRKIQVWYPGNGATGIPSAAPNFDGNFNQAISTPIDLQGNSLITNSYAYGKNIIAISNPTTLYIDVFQNFSDMNIIADNEEGTIG